MDLKFRTLYANEIDVRIGTQKLQDKDNKWSAVIEASYLLYKDARVDMALLDEVVGPMNWQRTHNFKDGKLYCSVGIRSTGNGSSFSEWVWKEDVGVESNTEAEKGQASDAFKRACFNWGIGRELYTAPFVYIKALANEDLRKVKMSVKEIEYNDKREITKLIIVDSKGNERYTFGCKKSTVKKETKPQSTKEVVESQQAPNPEVTYAKNEEIEFVMSLGNAVVEWCMNRFKLDNIVNMTAENYAEFMQIYNKKKGTN